MFSGKMHAQWHGDARLPSRMEDGAKMVAVRVDTKPDEAIS